MIFTNNQILGQMPLSGGLETVDSGKIKSLLLELNNWEKYLFERHIKFVEKLLELETIEKVAIYFDYRIVDMVQIFLKIQTTLEMALKIKDASEEKRSVIFEEFNLSYKNLKNGKL